MSPTRQRLTVIMRRETLPHHPWLDCRWQCHSVLIEGEPRAASRLQVDELIELFFWPMALELWPDEAESYYHNLNSNSPSLFIAAPLNQDRIPTPQIITVCGHLASSWGEIDMPHYQTPLLGTLAPWLLDFIQVHYRPEPRKKREREAWK